MVPAYLKPKTLGLVMRDSPPFFILDLEFKEYMSSHLQNLIKCSSPVEVTIIDGLLAFHSVELGGRALPTTVRQGTSSCEKKP
jgi:hypothetical protein